MKIVRTNSFKKDYKELPKSIQEKFKKKIILFLREYKTSISQSKKNERLQEQVGSKY